MPDSSIQLTVAVPDRQVLDAEVSSVQFPLTTGYIGILPGHAPLLAEIGTGVLTYAESLGTEHHLAIDGGAVEVLPDRVRILAEYAELAPEINKVRAQEALDRANKRLGLQSMEIDLERARRAVTKAQARIAASKQG